MSKVKAHHVFGAVVKLLGAAASVVALWECKRIRDEKKDPVIKAAEVMTK